jgi:hypothetical protein
LEADAPILFNALKHHLGYLQQLIQQTPASLSPDGLRQRFLPIGGAQLDFYTGPLAVTQIQEQVLGTLAAQELLSLSTYAPWLEAHAGYRMLTLSDSSRWVLRLGQQAGYWIHLHPARYSPHSLRLKAHTLKTALVLAIRNKHRPLEERPTLHTINTIRASLALPPLAERQLHQGLFSLLDLLEGKK